jgi:MFS transporter, Spinster family, sphingosine-1-phosphate transporter
VIAGLYFGSWRLAFLFTGIPGLILAFLAWRLREPRRNEADEEAAVLAPQAPLEEAADAAHVIPKGIFAQFRSLLRIKSLVVLIILQISAFLLLVLRVSSLSIFSKKMRWASVQVLPVCSEGSLSCSEGVWGRLWGGIWQMY